MAKITVIHSAFENTPAEVAKVDVGNMKGTKALEYAYRWTQNIQDSWSLKMEEDGNDNVEVVETAFHIDENGQKWGIRSTAMGDQMEFNGKTYYVDFTGFSEQEPELARATRRQAILAGQKKKARTGDDSKHVFREVL
tara:strand:- start:5868 stop:6281 length:414 start_codon:yes stop_codon:yes gene_type:complete